MASLYIKDGEVAARADRIARRLGTTKTDVVNRGLAALEERLGPEGNPEPDFAARMKAYRAANPLPPKVGEADKAFFDRLWGESDD